MKKLLFCAKNVSDYVQPIMSKNNPDMPVLNVQDSIHSPLIQKILEKAVETYPDFEKLSDSPLSCETEIPGLKLDFNFGLRLEIPAGNYRVKISDFAGGMIFFDEEISDVRLISTEKYFVHWQIEIFRDGENIFSYRFDLTEKPVLVVFPKVLRLGDTISMLPYVSEMKRFYRCETSMILPEYLREFAAGLCPEIPQVEKINSDYYATFYPGVSSSDLPVLPEDIRAYPFGRLAGRIFGFSHVAPKNFFQPTLPPVTDEPYVCIAVQASGNKKCWLWPGGWDIVVDYLKNLGYRVFCIDKEKVVTDSGMTIRKPDGAEDFTGDRPILERANMIYHAEFFVGLSSGLAWVANAVNKPVVLICGFSRDWSEFYTPYRVANRLVCNGCVNDLRVNFFEKICPYHSGTSREMECQKKISPRQVIDAIENLITSENLIPPVMKNNFV